MKNLLCLIGLHKWEESRPLHIRDIHPGFISGWETPTRVCIRCGKQEKWLPGYGGSEIGSWEPISREESKIEMGAK